MKKLLKRVFGILSYVLYKFPTLYFLIHKFIYFPAKLLDSKTLSKHVNKINWLYNPLVMKHTEETKLYFSQTDKFDEYSLSLLKNISNYYNSNYADTSGHWQQNISQDMKELHSYLLKHKIDDLNKIYGNFFRQKELHGISAADFYEPLPHRYLYLKEKILHDIQSFSEFLAITNVDCPEYSRITSSFHKNLSHIVNELESEIGFKVGFPQCSGSFGLLVDDKLITNESLRHIYSCKRIKSIDSLRHKGPIKILEIGAGYGGLCYYLNKSGYFNIARYDIIDLPIINTFQYYFLNKNLEKEINFYEDDKESIGITIYPNTYLKNLKQDYDLIINHDSFPEMPLDTVIDYVQFAGKCSGGILHSFNHECNAYDRHNTTKQTDIKKIFLNNDSLELIQRERSWVREGYVEEIYKSK